MVDVTGALLGVAFAELYKAIKKHITKARMFRSQFEALKSTCEAIGPLFNDMAKFDRILDRSPVELNQFYRLLDKGKILIDRCSRVGKFNFKAKNDCTDELIKLNDDIKGTSYIILCIIARDVKEVSVDFKEVHVDVKKLKSTVEMLIGNLRNPGVGIVNDGVVGEPIEKYVVPKAPAPDSVVGMDKQYEEVKSRLLDDGVSVIVISGIPGVGKTTLAKKIFHDEKIKGKFGENSFFFSASESFDPVLTIQKMCRLKDMDVSDIRTEDDAFSGLEKLVSEIGEKPILLVLDDVWSELKKSTPEPSKTESLLENFVIHNTKDYKILVTSRSKFPGLVPSICLEPLSFKNARDLLLKAATPMRGTDPNLLPPKETVDEIVRRCKRLPLALTVVGKSLRGQHPDVWKSRLHNWNDRVSILDLHTEILNCLHKSLVNFNSGPQTKDCFMDLGSFPEDHVIPACALIDMWAELHNLDFDGVDAMPILHELSNRSLIDLVIGRTDGDGKNRGYENDTVTQHDLLRLLTIHESSKGSIEQMTRVMLHIRGNTFPEWWIEQREQPINANLVSISTDGSFSSGWPDLDAHAAQVVVLNFRTSYYTLPEFIRRMTEIKTLIVVNNSLFPATLTNFHLLGSLSNLKRIRLERIDIPFLKMENIQLHNLVKISLFMCTISKEALLFDAAMPKLVEVSVSYCKNLVKLPAGICNLKHLRKLIIISCPDLCELPQSIGDLLNLEILRLNSCTELQELPESVGNLQKMTFLDISDCIGIRELPDQIGELSNLKDFRMEGRLNFSKLPPSIKKLSSLEKVTCHKSVAKLWDTFKLYLTHVEVKIVEEEVSLNWLNRERMNTDKRHF